MNTLEIQDVEALAAFRHLLRRFLRFSKDFLHGEGITPDQYQTLLAIRASPAGRLTVRELAEELQVKHHSTVGIVDQLVGRGLMIREVGPADRRKILLSLTEEGMLLLSRLVPPHREALCQLQPDMVKALQSLDKAQ